MPYPIAMIPYTNMAPYRELGAPAGCEFRPVIPTRSVVELKAGRVLAAAVPVGGLFALEGVVETVGRFGIAAKERSLSVLLFARRPWNALDRHCRLRLTSHSASSVRLLYLLLGHRLGFDHLPQLAAADEVADGELIIGDAALQRAARPLAVDNHIIDLATKWHRSQKLPFVFARWVVRKDAPPKAKGALADWLYRFQEEEDELVARCAPKAAAKLEAPLEAVIAYFRVIRRCLTEEDLAGQARFKEEFERHGREVLFG